VRLLWPSSTLSQPWSSVRGFTSDPAHWLKTEKESKKKKFYTELFSVSSNITSNFHFTSDPAHWPETEKESKKKILHGVVQRFFQHNLKFSRHCHIQKLHQIK
jgi:hypothetical protein